jgi:hypothetical protein
MPFICCSTCPTEHVEQLIHAWNTKRILANTLPITRVAESTIHKTSVVRYAEDYG